MNKILIALAILVASLAGVVCVQCERQKGMKDEIEKQKANVKALQTEQVKYKLNNSTMAVEVETLHV